MEAGPQVGLTVCLSFKETFQVKCRESSASMNRDNVKQQIQSSVRLLANHLSISHPEIEITPIVEDGVELVIAAHLSQEEPPYSAEIWASIVGGYEQTTWHNQSLSLQLWHPDSPVSFLSARSLSKPPVCLLG